MSEPVRESPPPRSSLLRPFGPQVPLILYGALCLAYFFSNFFRISAAVLLPRLAVDLGMTAATTGFISSLFFYTYGAVQPLCGALNDRYGPLRVGAAGMGICAVGVALFPDQGEDEVTLSKNADEALYVAKARGRDRAEDYGTSTEDEGA